MMRGELALAIAIVRLRDGDTATALSYLEAVKKAPMYGPHLFRLRLDYAVKARAALADQSAIDAAIEQGRALTIENILDRELRSPV